MDLPHNLVRDHFAGEARLWKEIYESETVEAAVYQTRQDQVLRLVDGLSLPARARVLELGCGGGWNVAALAGRGFDVHAVDLVPEMLASTRELAVRRQVAQHVKAFCADARALPFADGHFDLVIGIALLEWISSARAFSEIARVLRPGGATILTATNRWSLQRCLDPQLSPALEPVKTAIRRLSAGSKAHSRTHSLKQIDRSLTAAGLARREALTAGFGPFTFFKYKLMPGARGVRVHAALQQCASQVGRRLLRRAGYAYVVRAGKPATA